MTRYLSLLLALLAPVAFAQDTLTVSDTGGQVALVTYEWTSDGSGDATGRTTVNLPGILFSAVTLPGAGSDAPTANYDVVVKQVFTNLAGSVTEIATDLAGGELQDRSDTGVESVNFWPSVVTPTTGRIQIEVSNAGSTNQGVVTIAIARHLALQTHELSLTGGSSAQLLQYSAPGLTKYVTVSGHVSMADGGAVTIAPTFVSALSDTTPVTGDYLLFWDATDSTYKKANASNFLGAGLASSDITGQTLVTVASGDNLLIADASDSYNLKKIVASDFLSAAGTVTSVAVSGSDGIEVDSGSPITSSGTIALGLNKASTLTFLNVADGAEVNTVDSVNSQTGAVVLDADDIDDTSTTNKFVTAADVTNLGNLSGTNSGDVTVTGTPDYITISGQTITRGLVDLAADVTGVLAVANGGTGASSLASASIPTYTSTNTFTNKRITRRSGSTTSSATPTINSDSYDLYQLTAQAVDITSFTTNLSGTPNHGDLLEIEVTGTAARNITWGASFADGAEALPTATTTTETTDVLLKWNATDSKWVCMAIASY